MKIRIDERTYEGSAVEILDQLRLASFDPAEFPDAESYLWQLRSNFMRATDLDCVVDGSSISLAPPQAAGLAHSAASPLPTKPQNGFAGTPLDSGLERQARAMFALLAKAGAMEVLDDG